MDNSKLPDKAAHLLDDLESIRDLLGNEPPLLTDILLPENIPLLSDVVIPAPHSPAPALPDTAGSTPAPYASERLKLANLNPELRNAAQLLLQEVVDDFVPQIEAELKRRLEARLGDLLSK